MGYKEYRQIPNKLRESRETLGLTQIEVARLLKLQDNTLISRWESGDSIPSLVNVFKLSTLYKVSSEKLFSGLLNTICNEVEKS